MSYAHNDVSQLHLVDSRKWASALEAYKNPYEAYINIHGVQNQHGT